MSLMSPRFIAPLVVLSLAVLAVASCSQEGSPTTPSALMASTTPQSATATALAQQSAVTEYWVTLFDESPAPPASVFDVIPVPAPEPEPVPLPAPPIVSGSAPFPWPPGPPPLAAPGIPMPTPPSTHFRLRMKVDPEPVAHSGTPVPLYSCRDLRYTWYYDQFIYAETGVPVTFTARENFFDARFSSKNTTIIELAGNGGVVLHTRWCSAFPKPHYTQTRFTGRDQTGEPITISGPWVRLLAP